MSRPRYKSDAFEAIRTSAKALHKVGVFDKTRMRENDEACLSPLPEFVPRDIRRRREVNKVSQQVFARYLHTSESTVEKWETGAKRPSGMAQKLLAVVAKHGLGVLG